MKRLYIILVSVILFLAPVLARAAELTQITDTVYLADGSVATGGTVTISWPRFTSTSGRAVPAGYKKITVGADGSFTVSLEPTDTATPEFTYSVQYDLKGQSPSSENWSVPTSLSPQIIQALVVIDGINTPPVVRLTAKGDIGVFDGVVTKPLHIGVNGTVPIADSSQPLGIRWGTVSGSGSAGTGTVTSVGLSLPSIFSVSNSPVTSEGTLTGSLVSQLANTVFAGPVSGVSAAPGFRALVAADIPSLSSNKITGLSTVATTGSYSDLLNKPSIPTNNSSLANGAGYITSGGAPVQSVAGHTGAVVLVAADIPTLPATKISGLSAVATSGLYSDLTGTPTIPTALSQLANDSGFITSITSLDVTGALGFTPVNPVNLAAVATAGTYASLTGKPSIPSKTSDLTNDSNFLVKPAVDSVGCLNNDGSGNFSYVTCGGGTDGGMSNPMTTAGDMIFGGASGAPSRLAKGTGVLHGGTTPSWGLVNLSSDVTGLLPYASISGTPTIPTATSDLTNDSGFLTSITGAQVTTALGFTPANAASLSAVATSGLYSDLTGAPTIPTNNNTLTNGAGYVTSAQAAAAAPVQSVNGLTGAVVITVPTKVSDLSNDAGFLSNITSSLVTTALGFTPANAASLATVATTGSYTDLLDKPTIPTNNSSLTNGAGYITGITSGDVTSALGFTPVNATSLATVATTGSYNDLLNNPTIPTNNNQLTNGAGYLASVNVTDLPAWSRPVYIPTAGCSGSTAFSALDLPSANAPTPNCYGTSYLFGALDYADSANTTATFHFAVPQGFTSLDANLYWFAGSASQSVKWTIRTVCIASGSALLNPTFNVAQTISTTSGATANSLTMSSQTGVTATGCSAGNEMVIQIGRDTTDTSTAVASLRAVQLSPHVTPQP